MGATFGRFRRRARKVSEDQSALAHAHGLLGAVLFELAVNVRQQRGLSLAGRTNQQQRSRRLADEI